MAHQVYIGTQRRKGIKKTSMPPDDLPGHPGSCSMTEVQQESSNFTPLTLSFEKDGMQAIITYHGGPDPSFSEAAILQLLADRGVKYGIINEAIDQLTDQIRTLKGRQKLQRIVAQGMFPGESIDGRAEFFISDAPEIRIREDGRTDFRNIRRYKSVAKGQLIARVYPPVRGRDGINVFGEVVDAREPLPAPIKPGDHLESRPGEAGSIEYVAATEGIFKRADQTFYVSPDLIIEGNAGLETGNLSYNLSIIIRGNIERGTEVQAGKDLTVEGLVETGFLRVAGNISVTGGINSGGKGHILCGGDLRADFIENSHVICDGSIYLRRFILASTIISHGSIEFSESSASVIAGGEILHYADLKVGRIGNQNEIRTVLYPGLHYHNQQIYQTLKTEIQELEKNIAALTDYLRKFKEKLTRRTSVHISDDLKREVREKVQQYHKLQESVEKKKALFNTVQNTRRNRAPVKVYVKDAILPGTEFHFRGRIEKIRQPLQRVVLTFFPEDRNSPKYEPYPDR
jgi:uncharacterized protein (DUF342 family)